MFLFKSLLVLAAGYWLWVTVVAKQGGTQKTLGTFIAWLLMILGLVGTACGVYKHVTWGMVGCPYKKGEMRHPSHHWEHHSHSEHREKFDTEKQPDEAQPGEMQQEMPENQ